MRNISKDDKYLKLREEQLIYLQDKYKTNETDTYSSPSTTYTLTIEYYEHQEDNVRYDCTRGIVTNNFNNKKIEIIRNNGNFLFQWITHGGREYLLCGQDYQGYTIVDLLQGEIDDYVPEEAYEGHGFCWAGIHYLEDQNLLAVEGCYWAAEYEIIFYDFSNPLELPYKELTRVGPYFDVKGWKDSDCFEYYDEEQNLKEIKLHLE